MTILNSVLKSRFGKNYKLLLPHEITTQLNLKSERFWSEESTKQFVKDLSAPEGYWREIVNQAGHQSSSTLTTSELENKVSDLMLRVKVALFPVDIPDIVDHPPENRVIKGSDNVVYRFMPVSSLLLVKNTATKKFSRKDEALAFISSLNQDNEKLASLANELNIDISSSSKLNRNDIIETISAELTNGNIVVIEDKVSSNKKTEKSNNINNNIGNRPAVLSNKAEDNQNKNICSCSVVDLKATCSHNRKSNQNNRLQVVASSDKSISEEYELMGVKVTLKKEFGGTENINCTTTLKDNQSSGCFQITDINNKYKTSSESDISIDNNENDTNSKWPINVSPKKYTVSSRGCDNKIKKLVIEKYPSHHFTVQADVSVFQDWVKNVNKAWEDWGSKIFDVSPVEIVPKLTGPTGSFSANWGWKEDSDWKAFYNISTNFGLETIFGIEIKIMVSMTRLVLTSAGIPPNFSKLAAEHLADIQVSSTAKCNSSLKGSPAAKFYPDGTKKIYGEGKFAVEGGVNLELLGRVGSDYVISAELSVSGESKVSAEDLLSLNNEGVFLQSTIMLSPLIGIAKVKIRYLKIRTKTKEKKWEPWKQIELYKSENTKILP